MIMPPTPIIVWAVALVVFLIVEAVTAGLVSIWFAAGALAALVCALLKGPPWLQILWFVVVSLVTLILTKPLVKKYVNGRRHPTNADRSIGRRAVVTERIDTLAASGAVQLDGIVWTARSLSGSVLETGEIVTVKDIQGVKLLVERAECEKEE